MRIQVKVITKSKQESITQKGDIYVVHITVMPVKGKANDAVTQLLARHFKTAKSNIRIIRGTKSKDKIMEILA